MNGLSMRVAGLLVLLAFAVGVGPPRLRPSSGRVVFGTLSVAF